MNRVLQALLMMAGSGLFLTDTDEGGGSPSSVSQVTTQPNVSAGGASGEDWQAKYNGLQGAFKTTREKNSALEANLAAANEKLELLRGEKEDAVKRATDALTASDNAHKLALQELQGLKREKEDRDFIQRTAPELARDFADGILRLDGLTTDEEKTAYIQKYAARIGTTASNAAQQATAQTLNVLTGGTTPAPSSGASQTAALDTNQLFERLMSMKPGTPEYAQAEALYNQSFNNSDAGRVKVIKDRHEI